MAKEFLANNPEFEERVIQRALAMLAEKGGKP